MSGVLDSDIPVEDQQFYLDLHGQVYEATYEALTSNSYELDHLAGFLHEAALDDVIATVEANREAGSVLRYPDSRIAWVTVVAIEGARATVQECQLNGPESGPVDEDSGQRTGDRTEAVARILETRYALVEVAEGEFEHRAVAMAAGEDGERCDVA